MKDTSIQRISPPITKQVQEKQNREKSAKTTAKNQQHTISCLTLWVIVDVSSRDSIVLVANNYVTTPSHPVDNHKCSVS